MKKLLIVFAALTLGAGAASAADVYQNSSKDTYPFVAPTAAVRAEPFKGGWVGIEGGLGMVNNEIGVGVTDGDAVGYYGVLDGAGAQIGILGVNAGWNFQFGKILVGPAVYYNWVNGKAKATVTSTQFPGSFGADDDYLSKWGIGGRLGYQPWDHTLLYTGLYYTRLDSEVSAWDPDGPVTTPDGTVFPKGVTYNGWQTVLGIETMFSDHVSGKLEGSYSHYGAEDLYRDTGLVINSQPSVLEVKAGLSYHLN